MAYPPAPPAPAGQPALKQGNGFGVTALVLGIVGLVIGLIPIVNVIGMVLGALALIFGIVAIAVSGKRVQNKGKGTGWTGVILGVVAIGVAIAINVLVVNAVSNVVEEYREEYKAQCEELGYTTEECDRFIEDAENL